jgi:phosphoribosylglycinamide formyltransferase-1
MTLRVGVLASGRGSNLEALLRWQRAGALRAEVALVASNRAGARALEIARAYGVETLLCEERVAGGREAAQLEMSDAMVARGVGLLVLAGYDRVLAPAFVRRWEGRAINVHPSLLPAFGGSLRAQAAALRHGVKVTGCTVHFVTEEVDSGPIISQAAAPVLPGDDVESLSARIREQEHRLLPAAVRAFAEGRLAAEAGRRPAREERA